MRIPFQSHRTDNILKDRAKSVINEKAAVTSAVWAANWSLETLLIL